MAYLPPLQQKLRLLALCVTTERACAEATHSGHVCFDVDCADFRLNWSRLLTVVQTLHWSVVTFRLEADALCDAVPRACARAAHIRHTCFEVPHLANLFWLKHFRLFVLPQRLHLSPVAILGGMAHMRRGPATVLEPSSLLVEQHLCGWRLPLRSSVRQCTIYFRVQVRKMSVQVSVYVVRIAATQ